MESETIQVTCQDCGRLLGFQTVFPGFGPVHVEVWCADCEAARREPEIVVIEHPAEHPARRLLTDQEAA